MIEIKNIDCIEYMKTIEENYFDLAVVDPPYFSDFAKQSYTGSKYSTTGVKRNHKKFENWDIPNEEYFSQLLRISKNQIVWGVNYYSKYISSPGRIIWDKKNDFSTFSKCEIASHSFGVRVDQFRFLWNGMLQENMKQKELRIHPCQKPVALYHWIYENYTKPNQKILDTHLGSGSSALAAHDYNLVFTGLEIDNYYYNKAVERLEQHMKQNKLF